MSDDDIALNQKLSASGDPDRGGGCAVKANDYIDPDIKEAQAIRGSLVQWSSGDGRRFIPSSMTFTKVSPGVYEIKYNENVGLFFERIDINTMGLLRFPQTNSDKVVSEIQTFWERETLFRDYKLCYKRGIILWGPPGSGKSCTIKLINEDVVNRGGIVVKFGHPEQFIEAMRLFRMIQPDTPVVVLMEDLDSILDNYNESTILNILDGVEQLERCVYLATTNYPEQLGARIINRPSRFDKRFRIGHPDRESRRMYLDYLFSNNGTASEKGINLDQWVDDTEDFSIAHLKELFVAVIILGDEYQDAIDTLSTMREDIPSSEDDEPKKPIGFGGAVKRIASTRFEEEDDDDFE